MKIFKIIFMNLIVFLTIFLLAEGISFFIFREKVKNNFKETNRNAALKNIVKYNKAFVLCYKNYSFFFKKYETHTPTQKRPIVCLGCSYMDGIGLEEKEKNCLPALISKLTGRTVYKRAICGTGPQIILDEFENKTYKEDLPNDIEYFIYLYISYHLRRLYEYQSDILLSEINIRYHLKNRKIKRIDSPVFPALYSLFSVKLIQNNITLSHFKKECYNYNLFLAIMKKIIEEKQIQFPKAQFVIIIYPEPNATLTMPDFVLEKLVGMGYIIINAKNLTNKPIDKYRQSDNEHPSAEAWECIAPELIKKLNL